MRKKSFFLCFLLIISCFFNIILQKNICTVFSSAEYFARIITDDAKFYRSPEIFEDNSNVYFNLQKSYFVKIYSKENERFYKAQYLDKIGYVNIKDIRFVSSVPQKPYLDNVGFRVFAQYGLPLRNSPYTNLGSTNYIVNVPFLHSNLVFYGFRCGEESIIYKGDIWYYCKYFDSTNTYEGYLYSAYCDLLPTLTENNESVEYIDEPNLEDDIPTSAKPVDKLSSLGGTAQIVIICASVLVALVVILVLFKPNGLTETVKTKTKTPIKKVKKLRRSDYYELDDDFFNKS